MAEIVLVGGPDGLGELPRMAVAGDPERLTVDYYGRHQHFQRSGEFQLVDGRRVPVFRWSYSTAIAE